MWQFKIPSIDVFNYSFEKRLVRILPETLAKKYKAIILDSFGEMLTIAIASPEENPKDTMYSVKMIKNIKELEKTINKKILYFLADESDLDICINKEYAKKG